MEPSGAGMGAVEVQMQTRVLIPRVVAASLAGSDRSRAELFFSGVGTVRSWFLDGYDREDRDVRVRSDRSVSTSSSDSRN